MIINLHCDQHPRISDGCAACQQVKREYWAAYAVDHAPTLGDFLNQQDSESGRPMNPCEPHAPVGSMMPVAVVHPGSEVVRQLPEPSRKYARYLKWIAANPDLIAIGVQICRDRIDSGLAFYGGPKIAGDIRYHYQTVRGEEHFNVNNDFVPYLTRAINNELRMNFLEVRSAQADIDMNYRRWSV